MPIIRKNDVVTERPVIIVLYGTPGTGKTSLATTANSPLLIDTDRGFDRAVQRQTLLSRLHAGKTSTMLRLSVPMLLRMASRFGSQD